MFMLFVFVFSFTKTTGAATVNSLQDLNSSAAIEVDTQRGMYNWTIDGFDVMYQQWFWYRIGTSDVPGHSVTGEGPESSIDTLHVTYNKVSDTDSHIGDDVSYTEYNSDPRFDLSVKYSLNGGQIGSMTSDIAEQIVISNQTNQKLDFHFFQYTDFDIPSDPWIAKTHSPNDTAIHDSIKSILQNGTLFFSETVVTSPSHWAIAPYSTILDELIDGFPTTLWDGSNGHGDMTFAFEWDIILEPFGQQGSSYTISKDKRVAPVPEPGTMFLLGSLASGLFGFAGLRRRFNK